MQRLPADLQKALTANVKANAAWKDLTPIAQRDFITWIVTAKQQETRKRRIEKASDMLLSGKRRPCCYAVVPMNLYKALGANPKAKVAWKALTPSARRDFTDWIDSKGPELREERIEKVSSMLAAGKHRP